LVAVCCLLPDVPLETAVGVVVPDGTAVVEAT
jgi:hypothetical protein